MFVSSGRLGATKLTQVGHLMLGSPLRSVSFGLEFLQNFAHHWGMDAPFLASTELPGRGTYAILVMSIHITVDVYSICPPGPVIPQ